MAKKKEERWATMICAYCRKEIKKGEEQIEGGKVYHAICLSAIKRF